MRGWVVVGVYCLWARLLIIASLSAVCLVHVSQVWDDRAPAFQQAWHAAWRLVGTQLFVGTQAHPGSGSGAQPGALGAAPLGRATLTRLAQDQALHAVVQQPQAVEHDPRFAPHRLTQRLAKYGAVAASGALRAGLGTVDALENEAEDRLATKFAAAMRLTPAGAGAGAAAAVAAPSAIEDLEALNDALHHEVVVVLDALLAAQARVTAAQGPQGTVDQLAQAQAALTQVHAQHEAIAAQLATVAAELTRLRTG